MKRKSPFDHQTCPPNQEEVHLGRTYDSVLKSGTGRNTGNPLIGIYKQLKRCTTPQQVQSLKETFELCNPESNARGGIDLEDLHDYNHELSRLIENVKELNAQGEFPSGITIDAPPEGISLPTDQLVGREFAINMEKIERELKTEGFSIIGVQGMGGVGKTTLVKNVHNKVLKDSYFSKRVYWVTVSNGCSIRKLQDDIARIVLGQNLLSEYEDVIRAAILAQGLQRKDKFVLFLDDMWSYMDLKKVGITKEIGCKLILTTRSTSVCNEMGCNRVIKVDPLPEREAWNLFVKYIECDIPPDIEDTAKLVAEECKGLLLGIITLARSMRRVDDMHEWRYLLEKLKESEVGVSCMQDDVFPILRLSYDRLNDSKLQECLLYCALFREDFEIPIDELIWIFIGKGVFGAKKCMHKMIDEGRYILSKLERACLLQIEEPEFFRSRKIIKMHDLIRDMILQIAGSRFMIITDILFKDFSWEDEEWTEEDHEAISIISDDEMIDLPRYLKGTSLSILLFKNSFPGNLFPGNKVPDSFFRHLDGLRVLSFSYSSIRKLPESISNLKNLIVLSLRKCAQLRDIPSLAELTALFILDLSYTSIETLPGGLEKLINLRYLNLQGMFCLDLFPDELLCKLVHLEYLLLPLFCRMESAHELKRLARLEKVSGSFAEVDSFNEFVRHMNQIGRSNYYAIQLGENSLSATDITDKLDRTVYISHCDMLTGAALELPKDIKSLIVSSCYHITSLCGVSLNNNLTSLEHISVSDCKRMENMFSSPVSYATFPRLKRLFVDNCAEIKKLFTTASFAHFPNLEELGVSRCAKLDEIIGAPSDEEDANSEEDEKITINRFSLRLRLVDLPKLKSIGGSIGVLRRRNVVIERCPRLHTEEIEFVEEEDNRGGSSMGAVGVVATASPNKSENFKFFG